MNSTSPLVGPSKPVSRLTSVVLPAPFGPTTRDELARVHRDADVVERAKGAVGLADSTRLQQRAHAALRARRSPQIVRQAGDPAGKADHDERQDGAENEAPILRQRLQLVLQQRECQGADDRPEEVGEAAEHRHEHELAGLRPVDQLRIGETDAEAENGAADGAEAGGDDEGGEPKPAHVHAEIFGLAGIVANGLEVQAERRVDDPPHHQAG